MGAPTGTGEQLGAPDGDPGSSERRRVRDAVEANRTAVRLCVLPPLTSLCVSAPVQRVVRSWEVT